MGPSDKTQFILRNKRWLVHDQHSEMRFVWYHVTKDGMIDPMCGFFA